MLDGCIADLDAAPCDATTNGPTCDGLFEVGGGTAEEGDPCGRRYECAPGHFCEVVDAICTACRAEAALGEDCMFRYCEDDLHCDPDALLCAAPSPPGAMCDEPFDCASGFCDFGVCAARPALGAPCGVGAVCEGQLGCIEGVCALRRPATAACDDDDDCWLDHWCVAGTCTYHDYCAERPVGQRCEGAGSGGCAGGLYCDTMSVFGNVCQTATAVGELCSGSPECGPGAFCDFIGGAMVCATYAPAGGPCTSAFDCAGELFCSAADLCTVPGADGAGCDNANECETGYCSPGGGVCGVYPVCP